MPLPSLRFALMLPLAMLLSNCVDTSDYPSLAPRAAEGGQPAPEPAPTAPETPADPALAARIAQLVSQAHDGDSAFQTMLRSTSASVARSGAPQSDSWISAQETLSRLEAARAPTVQSLADLDAIARGLSQSGKSNTGDDAAIAAAIDEINAIAGRQQAEIDRLNSALPSP